MIYIIRLKNNEEVYNNFVDALHCCMAIRVTGVVKYYKMKKETLTIEFEENKHEENMG